MQRSKLHYAVAAMGHERAMAELISYPLAFSNESWLRHTDLSDVATCKYRDIAYIVSDSRGLDLRFGPVRGACARAVLCQPNTSERSWSCIESRVGRQFSESLKVGVPPTMSRARGKLLYPWPAARS